MDQKLADLQQDLAIFREECENLCLLVNQHEYLFGSSAEITALLRETAEAFFTDLHQWMTELFYLKVYRLTDKAVFKGRKGQPDRENLTVEHLVGRLQTLGRLTTDIQTLADSLHTYHQNMILPRHRQIAHIDLETTRHEGPLGAHSPAEYSQFLSDLQRFNDEVALVVGLEPCEFINISSPGLGDALDLIQFIRSVRRHGTNRPDSPLDLI